MQKINDNEIQVQVWDDEGNLVVDEIVSCRTASDSEINTMVEMIDDDYPAHLAAVLSKEK